jgi:addiction module HigA family antidote
MQLEEFITLLTMTQAELAGRIGVSYVRLNEIVNGRRGITPSAALRLAKALGTTPQFWLNGQLALDPYQASHDEEAPWASSRRTLAARPLPAACAGAAVAIRRRPR